MIICLLMVLSACNADSATINMANSVQEPTHFIAKFLIILNEGIGDFGWTVVVFTIILKLIVTPFDFWQKFVMRKNAKIMERIKPRLDELADKYKDDKQRYQQEQMAIYKREKYSMLGACLPTIITLVVFFIVFSGFRQMVSYQNALVYEDARTVYTQTYDKDYNTLYTEAMAEAGLDPEVIAGYKELETLTDEQKAALVQEAAIDAEAHKSAVDSAQTAVAENYKMPKFLWIYNIFAQDSWVEAVPNYLTFSGQSGFANAKIEGVMVTEYQTVMKKVLGTGGYGEGGTWNGLLIFPILSIALNIGSQLLMNKAQGKQPKAAEGMGGASTKMMQWIMPVLMGVFALLYSAAFTIYIFVSTLYSILFQLLFNLGGKLVDISREKKQLKGTR